MRILGLAILLVATVAQQASETAAPENIDYNRDVRPTLSASCFACHGADKGSRKGKLRLDTRDGAMADLDGDHAVVPGHPENSTLIKRVSSDDPELRMPPGKNEHKLSDLQILTLKRWIEQGAPYAEHWSFIKPLRPALPQVRQPAWVRNPVDAFILAHLEKEGLNPSPEADRQTLLRRLSLDLTGLPPSIADVDAFLNDKSADAYDKAVDRLLDSPAYGERWARVWLDLARYADSAGYGSDPLRLNIWPYRDWLINSFNKNKPYDQFSIEQLAGDLLPNPTPDQLLATAFHRNTMTNTEGGTDREEFRVAAVKDRVATTMQVWMGLTMGCAQCHSHKFDPLSQTEYYRFFALFNQSEDADRQDEAPTRQLPTPLVNPRIETVKARIAELEKQMIAPNAAFDTEFNNWLKKTKPSVKWSALKATSMKSAKGETFTQQTDNAITVGAKNPDTDTYTVEAKPELKSIAALRLEVLADDALPSKGPGRAGGNFVLNDLKLALIADKAAPVKLTLKNPRADYNQGDFGIEKAIGNNVKQKAGWGVGGASGKSHDAIFEVEGAKNIDANASLKIELTQIYGMKHTIGKFRLSVSDAAPPADAPPANIADLLQLNPEQRTVAQLDTLTEYYRTLAPSLKKLRDELAALQKEFAGIKIPSVPIMQERSADKRRVTKILNKGNFLTPGETVEPGIPEAFNPLPKDAPMNRLGVARWLISNDNPLTARVAVNRFWAQIFGTGIVETEEDFGTQGALPVHPELLDWLAVEFMSPQDGKKTAWDVKALLKMIVSSAAYRQSSRVTPELLEKDPKNRLISRGVRKRLDAEMVRDQALAMSGLLSQKIGGPSVFPPQPDGLWRAAFNQQRAWNTSMGEDKYRRGMYTFWRRTVPYPSMKTSDAPSRENCTLRRYCTNTPWQAFVTLNDPVYVEASQALGRRIIKYGGANTQARVRFGLRVCLAREASDEQVAVLTELYEKELKHYQSDATAAKKMATEPIGAIPAGMNEAELAAWTVVANVLLNLDAVLTKSRIWG